VNTETPKIPTGRERRQGTSQRAGKYGWSYFGPDAVVFRAAYDTLYDWLYRTIYMTVASFVAMRLDIQMPYRGRFQTEEPALTYDGPDQEAFYAMVSAFFNDNVGAFIEEQTDWVLEKLGAARNGAAPIVQFVESGNYRGSFAEVYEALSSRLVDDLTEDLIEDLVSDFLPLLQHLYEKEEE
jgi:hypothetical protein